MSGEETVLTFYKFPTIISPGLVWMPSLLIKP